LACRLATGGPERSNAKLGQKVSVRGHVAYFSKFWERLKLIILNLACKFINAGPKRNNAKLGQKGS